MENRRLHLTSFTPLLALTALLSVGTFTRAQSYPAQGTSPAQDDKSVQDRDQYRDDDNRNFRDDDATRRDLAQFDQFLDTHREIAEQLRRDPSLVNNRDFVKNHPALQTFLQDQPGVRDRLRDDPVAFMHREDNFDRREDLRDNEARREQLAQFDRFLDNHREIAEQLRKDPALADNREFVKDHPALQTFLQQQPGVRDQLRDNPTAFMRQENNFDRRDDNRDRDFQLTRFKEFLGSHETIARELSKDPTLIRNHEYVQSRPELQECLKANPGVPDQFAKNPQAFVPPTRQFNNNNGQPSKAPTFDSKPRP